MLSPELKRSVVRLSCLSLLSVAAATAQTNRIAASIDPARAAILRGSVSASARSQYETGRVDRARVLNHISINFKPAPAQQAELDQFLADVQDPATPNFHAWLTPEQFGDRFGLSPDDMARVTAWLRAAGFMVTTSAAARNWVAFDATVDAVERAFHTEIHTYRVNGVAHFANSTELSVPAAIAPLVASVNGLNDFRLTPSYHPIRVPGSPDYTNPNGNHLLAPGDYAVIYDINPLYNAGYNGAGQRLVILGQTDINLADINGFRSVSGLPAISFQPILVPGTFDPGFPVDSSGVAVDEGEADLDLEWSGAVARGATIVYVYAPNILDSAQYSLSPPTGTPLPGRVVSMSYGACEQGAGSILAAWRTLVQQANAQGVTFLSSSGDAGAAGCDRQGGSPYAIEGIAVEVPASVPEVTGVGGSQFNEGAGSYWSSTNSSTLTSALRYIPEVAWNESSSQGLGASGGGISIFYPKPAWQNGFAGVPNTPYRAVPDVALSAASHDGYLWVSSSNPMYPFCAQAASHCTISGTSAAAPSFAGIITILNQYAAAKGLPLTSGGQGNINPTLYKLFATTPNAFHDVVSGNNVVPCALGTSDCTAGAYGFAAGPGYDPVTGLGSVDVNNLITQWYGKSVTATTTIVSANPSSFTVNSGTTLTARVSASGGTPSGSVSFTIPGKSLGTVALSAGSGSLAVSASAFAIGSTVVTAVYGGDSNFNGSSSATTVAVSLPVNASAVIPLVTPNPVPEQAPNSGGYTWFYTVTLTETAGTATTLTGFTIGGLDYSSQIATFFGTASIGAKGALFSHIQSAGYTPPATVPFVFSGIDGNGARWSQTVNVILLPVQTAAALSLTSAPSSVYRNPAAPSNCQWSQNLEVQETNGFGVVLNRFLAGGSDLTSQISAFFGSAQVNSLGSLQAGICWSGISPPETLSYEVDGTDSKGNPIKSSATVTFQTAPATVSALSLSKTSQSFAFANTSQSSSATIAVNVPPGVPWSVAPFPANRTTSWLTVYPVAGVGPGSVTVIGSGAGVTSNTSAATLTFQAPQALPAYINVPVSMTIASNPLVTVSGPLQLIPVSPCRVMDTRNANGAFGGPFIAGGSFRSIPVPSGPCGIPSNAQAYSLNFTVVPRTNTLGALTVWPTGQTQPITTTVTSPDASVIAAASIVTAGTSGSINAYATDSTDLVVDINGYFVPPATGSLQFYPLTPCRVLDTRNPKGTFGGPSIAAAGTRSFPVPSSGCGAPPSAAAYSLNVTVVPLGPLGYISAWPTGQAQPYVSTLNSYDGTVIANAAIVPVGANGSVSFFASHPTDLVVDINGYFAAPGSLSGLNYYAMSPCRVVDTRTSTGTLGGPTIAAATTRTFPLPQGSCALPAIGASAYSLSITAYPQGVLGYLSAWAAGAPTPYVSTLNAWRGQAVSNAALVPASTTGGAINIFVSNKSDVSIDSTGYFAGSTR